MTGLGLHGMAIELTRQGGERESKQGKLRTIRATRKAKAWMVFKG